MQILEFCLEMLYIIVEYLHIGESHFNQNSSARYATSLASAVFISTFTLISVSVSILKLVKKFIAEQKQKKKAKKGIKE
jgi:hypothetical protein